MAKSRTENSIRNTGFALLGQASAIILSFITRTVFIQNLGAAYLGINGLFTNILSVLSFAELGFGTAIIYAMYKPLAENDQKQIAALMHFYSRIYRFVGIFVLTAGCCLIPVLPFLVGDVSGIPPDLPPLWVVYLLFLLNSSASYFFNYKRSIILASQNGHIDSLNTLTFNLLRNVLQIVVILVWNAYILFLVVQILCTFLGNVCISVKADKLFPYLKEHRNEKLDKKSLRSILKNVLAMACHKLGSVVVSGTDNILISMFVGVAATGYYSNYTLVTSTVRSFYLQLFSPVTASVGNLVAEKSSEESYLFFKKLLFINAYIAVFCTTCLTTLINPFIAVLWGSEYEFPFYIVAFLMLNFFVTCMRQSSCMFIDASGLFWQVRWKSVLEAVINLAASVLLARTFHLGIFGVVAGTTISTLTTNFWWEPYAVFKYAFGKKLRYYFADYLKYALPMFLVIAVTMLAEYYLPVTLWAFLLRCVISAVIPVAMMYVFFHHTSEYRYMLSLVRTVLKKLSKGRTKQHP